MNTPSTSYDNPLRPENGRWKENYFKHTDNYEPHMVFGSASINICETWYAPAHLPVLHSKENPALCRMLPMLMGISQVIGCLGQQLLMKPQEMYSRTSEDEIWTSLVLPSKRLAGKTI